MPGGKDPISESKTETSKFDVQCSMFDILGTREVTALAPMQDVTTLPFMRLLGKYGAPDLLFTGVFSGAQTLDPREPYCRLDPRSR